jgi:hypothetical protein
MSVKLLVKEARFSSFLQEIKRYFQESHQRIHKARNELKIITYHDREYVVKAFKIPNLINRFAYRFIRPSKAKRAYDNALKIASFTPKPIGYIEFYTAGLLAESYFVSEHFHYDFTIREPIEDANFPDREAIFKAFGEFTFALHEAGIWHKDYSPGNVLVQKKKKGYHFQIVDINRMAFVHLDSKQRMVNFAKQGLSDDDLKTAIEAYALLYHQDAQALYTQARLYTHAHQKRLALKWKLKALRGKK